jgi:PHS family inorganic phosphate transporter-like MFS transporter
MTVDESSKLLGDGQQSGLGWKARTWQVIIAGTGFLTDAYDLFVIDIVMAILHRLHPEGVGPTEKSTVASATLVGAVCGQLFFGLLGDWLGRRWTFLVTCFLIVFGAMASSCCVWTTSGLSLIHQLALFRFMLGFGVGGEYPLAATITAEGADKETRGRMVAAVFSMQGWGMLLSCVLALVFLFFEMPLEYIWRALLFIGALPVAAVIYFRAQMEETRRFKESHDRELEQSGGETVTFLAHLSHSWKIVKKFWHPMIGTTMTWLILDITFYGTGSFKTRISGFLVETDATSPEGQIWHEAVFATFVTLMAIPGYLTAVLCIEKIGRYQLQLWGFLLMSVNFFLCSYFHGVLEGKSRVILVVFFGMTFFFSNAGPNTTTFVVPTEVYPTLIRSTCHGVSAAAGKVGAVIGAASFAPMEEEFGLAFVLFCCGVTTLVGAVFTFFFTAQTPVDLDELDKAVELDDLKK